MSALIQVENLTKIYQLGETRVHALRDVSLAIQEGELAAIMGASGSGKSTLMNILGCLDRPTRGDYILDGTAVASLNSDQLAQIRNQKIGFVFQNFNLLNRTSALENVELPLYYNGTPARERTRRAREVLKMVGLEGRESHIPSRLSGGQQQRVAIARALVNRPSLLLADEPTGNLDTRTSLEVMEIFQNLNQNDGITILIVTHEPDIASYAGRHLLFRDGELIDDQHIEPQNAAKDLAALPIVTNGVSA